MLQKLKDRLIADARYWYKMWSIRIAAIASIIVGYIFASPDVMLQVLNSMPAEFRAYFSPVFGIALFGFLSFVRLYNQQHKKDKDDAEKG
jgi:hypothetical protein